MDLHMSELAWKCIFGKSLACTRKVHFHAIAATMIYI